MKICIISNLYPPFIRGGAEIIAALQAEGLKKNWQHVFVISTRPAKVKVIGKSPFVNKAWSTTVDNIDDIDVYRFSPNNIYYYLDDFKYPAFIRFIWHLFDTFNIFSYFKVKKILNKEKPELVITHNLMGMGFLIPKLIKRLKIRHVHIIHDVQLVSPSGLIIKGKENSLGRKIFKWLAYPRLMNYMMNNPEIVISPSKFLFDFYQQSNFFTKSKKFVLPNPIRSLIKVEKNNTPYLQLLYLGQINKAKGIVDFIENFRKIKLPHIRLDVVGVGQGLNQAKAKAKSDDRIKFYGWLNHSNLRPILSRADVTVVPSMCYENSPTVIYESLSMGLPVMAAQIGGTSELIKEGINGWTFPAGDFEALNTKIVSLYNQREKISKMADACRSSVAGYTLEKYTEKLLNIIHGEYPQKS